MHKDMSSYFEDSEFKDSLAKYEGMVESHTPTYFDAEELTDIAEYYASQNESEKSEAAIDYALHLHPSNTDALIFKSRTLYLKGDLQGAYQMLYLIEDKSDREVKFLHAEILMEERRLEEADAIHQELAILENHTLEILADITLTYIDAHQQEYADKWFQTLRDQGYNETNSQTYRNLWCDYCNEFCEHGKAINAYRLSLDEEPYSISLWTNLAKSYLFTNDIANAHDAIDFSLAIDENNDEAICIKGLCYMYGNNPSEAIPLLRKSVHTADNPKFVYAALVRCYSELNNAEESKNICIEWLKNMPELNSYEKAEIYCNISVNCYHLMDYQEAMKYIDLSLDLQPDYAPALVHKGSLYLKMDQKIEAIQYFKLAVDHSNENNEVNIMYIIANSLHDAHMYSETIRFCEDIIRHFPSDAMEAKYLITHSHFRLNDEDACVKMLTQIYVENDNSFDREFVEDERFKDLFDTLKNQR